MKTRRKGLGKKVRFEVFKRDRFTCQYCGRQAPDVVLVVDHIHPVAKGGADELLNLITSCDGCNAGKGATSLDDDAMVSKQRAQLELLAERRDQIDMMLQWSKGLSEQRDYEVEAFIERCSPHMGGRQITDLGRATVKKWLRTFNLVELLEALDISVTQYAVPDREGRVSVEAAQRVFDSVPGIARVRRLPEIERELFYVRGIVRRRFSVCDERLAIELLRAAVSVGVTVERLKEMARGAASWWDWAGEMSDLVGRDSPY